MLNVNIFGHYEFADLPNIPIASLTQEDLYGQLQEFAAAESATLRQFTAMLAEETTVLQEGFGSVQGGLLQRIGEYAQPEATRRGGKWNVAYPIFAHGDRSIYTEKYLRRASLADLNADAVEKTLRDVNTVWTELFKSFAFKTNYTFDDGPWPGKRSDVTLTIRRLANNDAQVGSIYNTNTGQAIALGTAQNYKTSGAATYGVGAFTTVKNTLRSYGMGDDIVYMVSVNDQTTVKGLTGFVGIPDPRLSLLPTTQTPVIASPRAIGRLEEGEVQVWPHWPDGYLFGFDRSKPRPLAIRLPDETDERGFRLVADETQGGERPGSPLVNKYWQRIFGVAVRNRFNGVMMQITTSGTYTDPAGLQ